MVRAIVVSRVSDTARRQRIEQTIPPSLDWSFLDATDGHRPSTIPARYGRLVAPTYWGNKRLKPGAIGCFLSHYRIWEACVAADEPVLALEDDALFNPAGPDPEALLAETGAGIVFMNERTVSWNRLHHRRSGTELSAVADLAAVIEGLVGAGIVPPHPRAAGTDCYLVTPPAARALIALTDRCGTIMGLDWFMMACAIAGRPQDGAWAPPARAVSLLPPGVDAIPMAVAGDWLVETSNAGVGASVIAHGSTVDCRAYIAEITGPEDP